jgi:hypothetical protein
MNEKTDSLNILLCLAAALTTSQPLSLAQAAQAARGCTAPNPSAWTNTGDLIRAAVTNVSILNNDLRNVRVGIGVGGNDVLVQDNLIDNFGDDAAPIDVGAYCGGH